MTLRVPQVEGGRLKEQAIGTGHWALSQRGIALFEIAELKTVALEIVDRGGLALTLLFVHEGRWGLDSKKKNLRQKTHSNDELVFVLVTPPDGNVAEPPKHVAEVV